MTTTEGTLRKKENCIKTFNTTAKNNGDITPKRNKFASVHAELQVATGYTTHRLVTRTVVVVAVSFLVYFYAHNQSHETKFALVRENVELRMQKFNCSDSYSKELQAYPLCAAMNKCGRFVSDFLVEPNETVLLLNLSRSIFSKVGSAGGASILDLHTGALSYGSDFVNVFSMPELVTNIKEEHILAYNLAKSTIKVAIARNFGIPINSLYLTHPTFFSRLTNVTAKTVHDEYWHEHVDKETYLSFHYTSLLYLNTYEKDFQGGRFIFVTGKDKNRTTSAIEPKTGRLLAFTSGEENRHHVEPVQTGERYAVTISFTCNEALAIADPKIKSRSN